MEAALRAKGGREGGSLTDGRVSRQFASFGQYCCVCAIGQEHRQEGSRVGPLLIPWQCKPQRQPEALWRIPRHSGILPVVVTQKLT